MGKRTEKQLEIIDKAKLVFLEKGLFSTVMDDIAKEVGLTRRTLYRYFETKEDLAYETIILLLLDWNDYQLEIFNKLSGTGIELLEAFLRKLIDHMEARQNVMRYIGEFDFYFKDGSSEKTSTERIEKFNSIILETDTIFEQILAKGIKDKSIKPDIDIHLMVATMTNVLWGFGQRVAIRGHLMELETGIKGIELIRAQVDLYIMALKE